jgi:hypothetical protein
MVVVYIGKESFTNWLRWALQLLSGLTKWRRVDALPPFSFNCTEWINLLLTTFPADIVALPTDFCKICNKIFIITCPFLSRGIL